MAHRQIDYSRLIRPLAVLLLGCALVGLVASNLRAADRLAWQVESRLDDELDASGELQFVTLRHTIFDDSWDVAELPELPSEASRSVPVRQFPPQLNLEYVPPVSADESTHRHDDNLFDTVVRDYENYYSVENMEFLSAGFAVAALLANTNADEALRGVWQENVRDAGTDEYFEVLHAPKFLGEGLYAIPVYAAVAAAGRLLDGYPWTRVGGEWGERSFRALLVGTPPLLAAQILSGASRPGESDHGSNWSPLSDENGASGHAFMGAVPLITAAQMTDRPFLKAAFYAASILPGLSRINDDAHYTSQVALGWWLAYLACNSVNATQRGESRVTIFPWTTNDNVGLGVELWR